MFGEDFFEQDHSLEHDDENTYASKELVDFEENDIYGIIDDTVVITKANVNENHKGNKGAIANESNEHDEIHISPLFIILIMQY